jgi:hypothetical protein
MQQSHPQPQQQPHGNPGGGHEKHR